MGAEEATKSQGGEKPSSAALAGKRRSPSISWTTRAIDRLSTRKKKQIERPSLLFHVDCVGESGWEVERRRRGWRDGRAREVGQPSGRPAVQPFSLGARRGPLARGNDAMDVTASHEKERESWCIFVYVGGKGNRSSRRQLTDMLVSMGDGWNVHRSHATGSALRMRPATGCAQACCHPQSNILLPALDNTFAASSSTCLTKRAPDVGECRKG